MYNILTDDIIRFGAGGEIKPASLPETYAALMRDEVGSFPALRPHQRHAWHAFTVQLGAMALHRAGLAEPPTDAETWREIIRGLTPEFPDDEPWRLVVDDITKPAFMQPPASSEEKMADYKVRRRSRKPPAASEEKIEDYKSVAETPDKLDMLATSKNHDLKSSVADLGGAGDWLFALISLQTSEGYPGSGNYGISRMNKGFGNRPAFSLTPSTRHGAHARRDIAALLEYRDRLLDDYPMRDDGICLVWTLAWDGTKGEALTLDSLYPFYIEICRRIRLRTASDGVLYAIRATSKPKGRRIEAEAANGVVGDPWTPINIKENKSLTIGVDGFTYKETVKYLTSADWQWPPLLNLTAAEKRSPQAMQLVARAMVRGRGKTEGYHERTIPLRPKTIQVFGRVAEAQALGDIARDRIKLIELVSEALKDALAEFVHQGKNIYQLNRSDLGKLRNRKDVGFWVNRLDETVDVSFFEDLQSEFDADNADERERVRSDWLLNDADGNGLTNHAHHILSAAMEDLPCSMMQRYRAQVNASRVFRYGLRKNHLPIPFTGKETTDEEKSECPNSEPT